MTMLDVAAWDPRAPSFRADPYPCYHALRERAPVHRHTEVGYVISRYIDVEAVQQHAVPELRMLGECTLLFIDPPAHSRVGPACPSS